MPDTPDPRDTFNGQRHEFILHYYDMSVKDLERHLQVGWQSISFAAGVIAVLSAGQQNYLPIPLATTAALAISFWGIYNILDADLWARRAIAFLANVEAVYFTLEERRVFNPYAGSHPRMSMFGSLRAQMAAAYVFIFVTISFFIYSSSRLAQNFLGAGNHLSDISHAKLAFWLSPIAVFVILIVFAARTRRDKISDYTHFVTACPGPGMLKTGNTPRWRGVDLRGTATPDDIEPGEQIQREVRERAVIALRRWDRYVKIVQWMAGIAILALVLVDVFQRCILS